MDYMTQSEWIKSVDAIDKVMTTNLDWADKYTIVFLLAKQGKIQEHPLWTEKPWSDGSYQDDVLSFVNHIRYTVRPKIEELIKIY